MLCPVQLYKFNEHINEPTHDRIYNNTCATSEDSDQPAHPHSLIRVFADRMCRLQPPGYPKRAKREPSPYWSDVQADLSLDWLHRSYCKFSRTLALIRDEAIRTVESRSADEIALSDMGFCSASMYSTFRIQHFRKWIARAWSDCADVQAGLGPVVQSIVSLMS